MKPGIKLKILITVPLFFIVNFISFAEEKITSSPLINLDQIKPSFEELEDKTELLYLFHL